MGRGLPAGWRSAARSAAGLVLAGGALMGLAGAAGAAEAPDAGWDAPARRSSGGVVVVAPAKAHDGATASPPPAPAPARPTSATAFAAPRIASSPDATPLHEAPVLKLGELSRMHVHRELIAWAVVPCVLVAWALWAASSSRPRRGGSRRRRSRPRLS